jgi:hypothetical protein
MYIEIPKQSRKFCARKYDLWKENKHTSETSKKNIAPERFEGLFSSLVEKEPQGHHIKLFT